MWVSEAVWLGTPSFDRGENVYDIWCPLAMSPVNRAVSHQAFKKMFGKIATLGVEVIE